MQPGHVSLPNGLGLDYPGERRRVQSSPAWRRTSSPSSEDRDWLAGTPWHKHVPARLEAVDRRRPPRSIDDDAPHPLRRVAVPDRPGHRPRRRLVDAARAARAVRRAIPLRRHPGGARLQPGRARPSGSTASSTRACSSRCPTRSTRRASTTGSPTRVGPSGTCWPRCGAGARTGCGTGEPPVVLVDRDTRAEVRPLVVDEATGEHVDVRRLRVAANRRAPR